MAARKAKSKKSPEPGKSSGEPKVAASKAKRTKTRRRHSDAERQRILDTARREGLSGPKAAKRFGISTLTFYNWRKKSGTSARGHSKAARGSRSSGDGIAGLVRDQVRSEIQSVLPAIVREEVDSALLRIFKR